MKAKRSPLKWVNFGIINLNFDYIHSKELTSEIKSTDLFERYQIEMDFMHVNISDILLQIRLKVGINNISKPKPGYRIFVEAFGTFDISEVLKLGEAPQQNLKIFATTNLMIGRVRGILPSITSQAPFGPYELPPIDLADLLNKKKKEALIKKKADNKK